MSFHVPKVKIVNHRDSVTHSIEESRRHRSRHFNSTPIVTLIRIYPIVNISRIVYHLRFKHEQFIVILRTPGRDHSSCPSRREYGWVDRRPWGMWGNTGRDSSSSLVVRVEVYVFVSGSSPLHRPLNQYFAQRHWERKRGKVPRQTRLCVPTQELEWERMMGFERSTEVTFLLTHPLLSVGRRTPLSDRSTPFPVS